MKIHFNRFLALMVIASFALATSCKKKDTLVVPPLQAHFANQKTGSYFITGPSVSYKIPVGVTTVSNVDRTINISVTSPTGAVAGTHYNLPKTSIVIPAGQALDSLTVNGVFAQYQAGRKDTLVFTIQPGPGVAPADYNSTFKLFMRGPCAESEIGADLNAFLGSYTNSNENGPGGPYGPYTTAITSITRTGPTTANIVVSNIYDAGWAPITFTMDWTDINNRIITLVQQSGIADGSTLSSAYAGRDVSVRPAAGQTGTFSYCSQTLTIRMQLGITNLGWFTTTYVLTMAR